MSSGREADAQWKPEQKKAGQVAGSRAWDWSRGWGSRRREDNWVARWMGEPAGRGGCGHWWDHVPRLRGSEPAGLLGFCHTRAQTRRHGAGPAGCNQPGLASLVPKHSPCSLR